MLAATHGGMLIWNNIDESVEDELNDWYNRQHLFERSSIDGVLRARRFRAVSGRQRYFVSYEAQSPTVFGDKEYLSSVNNPLPRTQAVVSHFRDTVRTIHKVIDRYGDDGGIIATLRVRSHEPDKDAAREVLRGISAKQLALQPSIVGATVFEEEATVSSIPNTEKDIRVSNDERCDWVVFIEAIDVGIAQETAQRLSARFASVADVEVGIFHHIVTKYHGSSRDF